MDGAKRENILVRAPNWIGDAVMCLPAIEALRGLYPGSGITVLTRPGALPVFENNPAIDGLIPYDGSVYGGIKGRFRLSRELKGKGFTVAVLFQNAFDAAFISCTAGIPERIGYARDLRKRLLTRAVPVTEEVLKVHQVFYYLRIVESLGASVPERPRARVSVSSEEEAWAEGFLKEKGLKGVPLVGAAPGASYGPAKRWPPSGFAEILSVASGEFGLFPVIFGGKDDKGASGEVSALLKTPHLDLAGELSLRQAIALLKRLRLFVTNDSGPMHIASAVGAPTIAVFGSTDPDLTGPLSENARVVIRKTDCSPCFERTCRFGHYQCLTSIGAGDLYPAVRELMKGEALRA